MQSMQSARATASQALESRHRKAPHDSALLFSTCPARVAALLARYDIMAAQQAAGTSALCQA